MDCIRSSAFAKERCGNLYMMNVPRGIKTPTLAIPLYICLMAVY